MAAWCLARQVGQTQQLIISSSGDCGAVADSHSVSRVVDGKGEQKDAWWISNSKKIPRYYILLRVIVSQLARVDWNK